MILSSGCVPNLSLELSLDGVVQDMSESLLRALGYKRDEIVGKGGVLLMGSSWRDGMESDEVRNAIDKSVAWFAKVKLVGKEKCVWTQSYFVHVANQEGKVSHVRVFCLDVTSEVKAYLDFSGQVEAIRRSQGVMTFALDGTILEANDICLRTMGYTLEEVTRQHHRMFVSAAYAASQEYALFWERLRAGRFHAAEFKRFRKDGGEVWLQATYNPILDAEGVPFKIVKYSMDVTEQKLRAAELLGQVTAIRKSQGVVTFALDGTILDANEIFLAAMGYLLEEVKGRHHCMFVSDSYAASREYALFWERFTCRRVSGR